ncbi:MAG: hypothetical protein AAF609_25860 [Cyanobacteria bacterium P01_C01_bin.120]
MSTFPVRIRLSEQEEEELASLADALGYIHGGKPSLTGLLRAIAQGEVQLEGRAEEIESLPNQVLYMLTIEAPFSLNGVVAEITEILGEFLCNIVWLTAKHKDESVGELNICFTISSKDTEKDPLDNEEVSDKDNIVKMINRLNSIRYSNIDRYNEFREGDKMLEIYNELLARKLVTETTYREKFSKLLNTNLLYSVSLGLSLRIFSSSQPGTVAAITKEVADSKLMVSSIELNSGLREQEDEILAFLRVVLINSYSSDQNSIEQKIEKLISIRNLLDERVSGINKIQFASKKDWLRLMNNNSSSAGF